MVDIAYIVRPGDDNEELRYSLRSVEANVIGFDNLWIVGSVPKWIRNAAEFRLRAAPHKWDNIRRSVTKFVNSPDSSDQIVFFNDDMYVRDKIDVDTMVSYHLGSARGYMKKMLRSSPKWNTNTWFRGLDDTTGWLQKEHGIEDPLCFESHVPLMWDKAKLSAALAEYPHDPYYLAFHSLHPLAGIVRSGGLVKAGNAKIGDMDPRMFHEKVGQDLPYLSSDDKTFEQGLIGGYVRGMFREPSRWEAL